MKINNISMQCTYGDNIKVNINSYKENVINVNANYIKSERSISVNLLYDSEGVRQTEVSDYTIPFDQTFYDELDAIVTSFAKVAEIQ